MKSVVLIDGHDIVRFGIEMLIREDGGMVVVGSARTLHDGLGLIGRHAPDLVVSELATGDSDGLDTVRRVVAAQRPRPAIFVSGQDESIYGEPTLAAGALAYVAKASAHASLLAAMRAALQGQAWVSRQLSARLVRRLLHDGGAEQLTAREMQVLELLKTGRTTKEIAVALDLSARTVDLHRSNIKRKLGLRTGAELIAYASSRL